jgi:hypothetical protein
VTEQATSRAIATRNHPDHLQRRPPSPTNPSGNKLTLKRSEQQLQQPKFNCINYKKNSWKQKGCETTDIELNKISRIMPSFKQRIETGRRQNESDWKYKQHMTTSDRDTRQLGRKTLEKLLPL